MRADANLDLAVDVLMDGAMYNAGQCCCISSKNAAAGQPPLRLCTLSCSPCRCGVNSRLKFTGKLNPAAGRRSNTRLATPCSASLVAMVRRKSCNKMWVILSLAWICDTAETKRVQLSVFAVGI